VSEPELLEGLPDDELVEPLLELEGIPGTALPEEALGMPGAELLEDELDGIDGIEAVDDDEELDGEREDDEEELGIDGPDDGEDDELGIDGMPPLLLELCWVDSQPARTRARAAALI
jgi:hypothetical protein